MRRSAAALIMVFVVGCQGYRAPQILITRAAPAERTDEALKLVLGIDLHNPNSESIELLEFAYEVSIDGRRVYQGRRAAQATLAPNDSRHMAIPAIVPLQQADGSGAAGAFSATYAVQGTLKYVTPGEIAQILLDLGVRRPTAGFRGAGTVTLQAP